MKPSLERTLDLMNDELALAGYSPKTVSSYLGVASRFLRRTDKPTRRLTHKDVRQHMLFLTRIRGRQTSGRRPTSGCSPSVLLLGVARLSHPSRRHGNLARRAAANREAPATG
jgi:hypothetical protein